MWHWFIYFGIWSRNCSCEAGHFHSIHSYRMHLQCVLILFFAAQPVWNVTVRFSWAHVTVKLKLSKFMPWGHMEECRCSATGSSSLTQEEGEKWVSCPRCFTQGETAASAHWIGIRTQLLENWKYLAYGTNWATIPWLAAHEFALLKCNLKSYPSTTKLPYTSLEFIILKVIPLKLR